MPRVAALVSLLLTSSALAYTADELAAKNVAALGGSERLSALHTLRLTGTLRTGGGAVELELVTLLRRPGSIRYEAQLQGLTKIQAYDGAQAWQVNPFQGRKDPERLSADGAKALGEDAADFIGVLVDYRAKGYTLEYLGTEDVEGTQAHKLRVTRRNGDFSYVYLDPDYFLEIRTIDRRIEHGVPIDTVTDYDDYEKVAGVYLAFAQESGPKGSTQRRKVQYGKAEANAALEDSVFRFPAGRTDAPAPK
jgi:outer membrane lipoprotein-sorting protein